MTVGAIRLLMSGAYTTESTVSWLRAHLSTELRSRTIRSGS